jgi:biopolymer transport protein ExbB
MNAVEAAKQLFLRSGADWILWLLVGLSLISLAVVIERWLYYRSQSTDLRQLAEKLDGWLRAGEIDRAIAELTAQGKVAATVAAAGLRLADRGPASVERAMQSAIALERGRLERWLAYLGTLGNNAPFVGLFGTVIGVVHAFEELGHGAPGHGAESAPASMVASQAVMASIAEALVATAVGLLVALPAVAAYNYYQRRVAQMLSGTEVLTNLVLAYLSAEKGR